MTAVSAGSFTIAGPAGRLECVQKLPAGEPRLAAVLCHPHPLYGGTMHSKVVYRAAAAIVAIGGAAIRFNFRGAGASGGTHDAGRGEVDDAHAVLADAARRFAGLPLLAGGFSFGAWVALRAGAASPHVAALLGIGIAPGLHDYSGVLACPKAKLFVQGSEDEFGPEADVRAFVERAAPPAELIVVRGAGHFFDGHLPAVEAAVRDLAERAVLA